MKPINDRISETIHDADSHTNEVMVHWLHMLIEGQTTLAEVNKQFQAAYETQEGIDYPWNS